MSPRPRTWRRRFSTACLDYVLGHDLCVLPYTVEDGGLRLPLKVHSHEVQPGDGAVAVVLDRKAHLVENRKVYPAIVRTKAGGPDHRTDALTSQVELGARCHAQWGWNVPRDRQPALQTQRIDPLLEDGRQRVAGAQVRVQVAEQDLAVRRTGEPARELDALRVQGSVVEVVTAAVASRLRVSDQTGGQRRQIRRGAVPEARLDDPPDQVVVPEHARSPAAAAAGEDDPAAGLVELLRQLAARLAAADDQHWPGRQRLGIAVLLRQQLRNGRGNTRRPRRQMGSLVAAGCDHDGPRLDRPGGSFQGETGAGRVQGRDGAALPNRCLERAGPLLQVPYELVAGHEAVWFCALVTATWELHGPVRRDQAERVPPPRPPCLGDAARLEDDVLDPRLLQMPARGEAGLPGADDGDVDALGHSTRSPSAGSTVTPRDSRYSTPRSSSSGSPVISSITHPWSPVTSARRMLVTISNCFPSW